MQVSEIIIGIYLQLHFIRTAPHSSDYTQGFVVKIEILTYNADDYVCIL